MSIVYGDAVLMASSSFVYHAEMSVVSMEPAVGLLGGGTRVRVHGTGFDVSTRLYVSFGPKTLVTARVLSVTLLEVISPAHTLAWCCRRWGHR